MTGGRRQHGSRRRRRVRVQRNAEPPDQRQPAFQEVNGAELIAVNRPSRQPIVLWELG
jgi:hypothetical protein